MTGPIYVVDDEPYIRAAVLAILTEAGYGAQAFESSDELYQRVFDWPEKPALIIVDEMLPNGDSGDQIVRTLRQRPAYQDIPFIFLTAVSSDAADRLNDLAPVVRKPFDFGDLVTRVHELVGPPERGAS